MAALLLLCYAAICVAIFKILRVPLNKWTVTTAGLGGVVIIGGLLAGMNCNHPDSLSASWSGSRHHSVGRTDRHRRVVTVGRRHDERCSKDCRRPS